MNALTGSVRAELLRLRKWPAVWVTLGAWVFLAILFGYLFNYVSYRTGDTSFRNEGMTSALLLEQLSPRSMPHVLIQGMPMFGGALMMVLGAIVAGNGYGWGTWKTIFTQGPSRLTAVCGSLLTLAGFLLGLVLFTAVLFLGISTAIALSEGQSLVMPSTGSVVEAVLAGWLVLGLWSLAGFAIGTLARGPALAVGLGLVWALVIEPLLRGAGALLGPVESLTHVLPGTAAGSLIGSIIGVEADPTPGVLHVLSGGQALVTVAVYVVLLPALTLLLVQRRDVI
jgi:ABC-2 type transport system permease protein